MAELTAQQRANQKQNQARKGQSQFALRLTDQEAELLDLMAADHGGKKAAILKGLELLKNLKNK